MRGIILQTTLVREDDVIAKIAAPEGIFSAYRFYGMRHSALAAGAWVDFELERSGNFLPKMRRLMQLRLPFELGFLRPSAQGFAAYEDASRLLRAKMAFAGLIFALAKHSNECEFGFYYDEILAFSKALCMQDAQRAAVDVRARILRHEGELATSDECARCGVALGAQCVIGERFSCYCAHCASGAKLPHEAVREFLKTANSAVFEDEQIEQLFKIALN